MSNWGIRRLAAIANTGAKGEKVGTSKPLDPYLVSIMWGYPYCLGALPVDKCRFGALSILSSPSSHSTVPRLLTPEAPGAHHQLPKVSPSRVLDSPPGPPYLTDGQKMSLYSSQLPNQK